VYAWSFVVKHLHFILSQNLCELLKRKFYQIKGECEIALCRASNDTFYGPNQIFPKILLNFED
jgi:hypothetical protein